MVEIAGGLLGDHPSLAGTVVRSHGLNRTRLCFLPDFPFSNTDSCCEAIPELSVAAAAVFLLQHQREGLP